MVVFLCTDIDFAGFLTTGKIETVLAGDEYYPGSRPLNYDWMRKVYEACVEKPVQFIFGRTGNVFIKDGKEYKIRSAYIQELFLPRGSSNLIAASNE